MKASWWGDRRGGGVEHDVGGVHYAGPSGSERSVGVWKVGDRLPCRPHSRRTLAHPQLEHQRIIRS